MKLDHVQSDASQSTKILNGLVEGIDYVYLENFTKPILLKNGAEKIMKKLGFSFECEVIYRDFLIDKPIYYCEVKVTVIRNIDRKQISQGLGACHSSEKGFAPFDEHSRHSFVLKMAKKRALVDAVIAASFTSHLFTQDLNEVPLNTGRKLKLNERGSSGNVTGRQLDAIKRLGASCDIEENILHKYAAKVYGVERIEDLSKVTASKMIQDLMLLETKSKTPLQRGLSKSVDTIITRVEEES